LGYKVKRLEKNLNIITLNIPYPPDYGGMIDSYFRIKTLHDLGVKIHLHCFTYGRGPAPEIETLCESVNYYRRRMFFFRQFSCLPFIVNSRRSGRLIRNLLNNNFPVLFDGLHTSYLLDHPLLEGRRKFVRLHNIEHNYYMSRARHESNPFRKIYFRLESFRLKQFEKVLSSACAVFPVSGSDHGYFNSKYKNSVYIEPFHPFNDITIKTGSGNYILYHGDISVNENEDIARMLITEVFSKVDFQCILAGKKPSGMIKRLVSNYSNIKLVGDPDNNTMMDLAVNAHIHLIPAAEPDGFKLKLLIALMAGRHCVVNNAMISGPGLMESITIADTPSEMIEAITRLMKIPFTEEMIAERKRIIASRYSNISNAGKMIEVIFRDGS
jgi:hypothetical protein